MAARQDLQSAAWLVFVGLLVVLVDIDINGFDLVNDVLGAWLVTSGLVRLHQARLGGPVANHAVVAAVVWSLLTLVLQVGAVPGPLVWIGGLAGLATAMLGVLAFRGACRDLELDGAAASWSTSLLLVAWIWGGLAWLAGIVTVTADGAFQYEGPAAGAVVVLAFVPAVHVLVSLKRTTAAVEAAVAA